MKKFKRYYSFILFLLLFLSLTSLKAYAQSVNVNYIFGKDRYETAVKISQSGWAGGSENVILASGEQFPDSLSAGPLAAKLNAPILLTGKSTLNSFTYQEIVRLKARNIYIIGGSGAVSSGIESYLKNKNYGITRIGGIDRYETSVKIAAYLGSPNEIFIATGENFPDAMSIVPVAAMKTEPIILADDNYTSYLGLYLSKENITRSYILGGEAIVGQKVYNMAPNHVRIFGNNRYDTNKEIFKYFADDFQYKTMFMTTGKNFPDALTGGIIAGLGKAPVLLSDIGLSTNAENIFNSYRFDLANINILGGNPVTNANLQDSTGAAKNASSNLNILTYDGSNQCNHPKVLYFSNGFAGYKYWMSYTPYPFGRNVYENPSIAVSNNGIDWTVPVGAKNPVINWPGISGEYNSDPNLVYNSAANEIEMWYRYSKVDTTDIIYRVRTKDGINWTAPEQMYSSTPSKRVLSPSVIIDDNKYKMWYVTDVNEGSKIRYIESTDGFNWTDPVDVTAGMPSTYVPWHMDVTKIEGEYHFLISSFKDGELTLNNRVLMYGASPYENTIESVNEILGPSSKGNWDDGQIYRSSEVCVNGIYKLYYSAMGSDWSWHIGLTQGRSLQDLYGLKFN